MRVVLLAIGVSFYGTYFVIFYSFNGYDFGIEYFCSFKWKIKPEGNGVQINERK
jgi:hypothetical protein